MEGLRPDVKTRRRQEGGVPPSLTGGGSYRSRAPRKWEKNPRKSGCLASLPDSSLEAGHLAAFSYPNQPRAAALREYPNSNSAITISTAGITSPAGPKACQAGVNR
ncbi:hypothetical protein SAMN06296416_102216 [Pseudoxanthomonas wuyuanensis]|uniref:Uncharacterized protein n=1 Tax=Pseudoxanthomonas wuyuanensis TaxID=1073196 RepID=A0A286D346_9GAMM|nr:hypothetical protein SAMN06296416_102216 [Pseudoxanthomonas wuyuanensis]